MSKADKKQRHKARREAKRREWRRQQSVSPVRRLAKAPGDVDCWMSDSLEEQGQAQVFVFKRGAGMSGIAAFLIDRGVVGLKDAWTRRNIDRAEFDEMIEGCNARGIPTRRATIDEARGLVAGAMRWAHEHGMRLPKDWDRAAAFLGGVGEWMTADTSAFVKEFAGHPQDLRQRLVGESFDSFTQREDIAFLFSSIAPFKGKGTGGLFEFDDDDDDEDEDANLEDMDDEEIEAIGSQIPDEEIQELASTLTPAAAALARETATWLSARNVAPAVELIEAWQSVMIASMLSKAAMPDAPEDQVADFGFELLKDLSGRFDPARTSGYKSAVEQVLEHLETDTTMMQKAVVKYGGQENSKSLPELKD
jgi:hypothetical protein